MKRQTSFLLLLVSATMLSSCKKEEKNEPCSAPTARVINNKPAVIKLNATINGVTIVEQGSIDTWLIPCNLPQDFYQNDLQVVISGEAKETRFTSGICCPQHFFITKISR